MRIYISYSDADEKSMLKLLSILQSVSRQFGCTVWSRKLIRPGKEWQEEMAKNLDGCFLFVNMLSSDLMASDMCDAEFQAALRLKQQGRIKEICSVNLRTCLYSGSFYDQFPVFPKKVLAKHNDHDEFWNDVLLEILKILKSYQIEK